MPAALSASEIDLSYASPCDSMATRLLIHVIEAVTGQLELKRLYNVYQTELRGTVDFWDAAMRLMQLSVDYDPKKLDALPRTGPLMIVANHPFGLIDGLLIGHLANRVRNDFKVLTNSRLYPPDTEIRNYILPIDFDPTPTARDTNLESRAVARSHIKSGGCIIVFPAGASRPRRPSSPGRRWISSGSRSPRGWCMTPRRRWCRSSSPGRTAGCSRSPAISA
jgi:putative hemolysin